MIYQKFVVTDTLVKKKPGLKKTIDLDTKK